MKKKKKNYYYYFNEWKEFHGFKRIFGGPQRNFWLLLMNE